METRSNNLEPLMILLKNEGIIFECDKAKEVVSIGEYPADIRITKCDRNYLSPPDYPATGIYRYDISWVIWNRTRMQHDSALELKQALKIIKKAMKELGISKTYQQNSMF